MNIQEYMLMFAQLLCAGISFMVYNYFQAMSDVEDAASVALIWLYLAYFFCALLLFTAGYLFREEGVMVLAKLAVFF